MVISDEVSLFYDWPMPMATKATALFVVADRVNIRTLAELTDKILYSLNYDMGRLGLRSRVAHSVKIV